VSTRCHTSDLKAHVGDHNPGVGQECLGGTVLHQPRSSGAKKATPLSILIIPPDERDSLYADWEAGAVPVSSAAPLTAFQAGTGA
jgi:hypothetical protein